MSQSFGEDLKVVSPPLEPGSPAAVRQRGKALAGVARARQESGAQQIGQGAGKSEKKSAHHIATLKECIDQMNDTMPS